MRLQDFLRAKTCSTGSARQLKRSIESGDTLINGKVERFASKPVGTGDIVTFHTVAATPKSPVISFDPQRVLYVDDAFLIYNKPAKVSSDNSAFLAAIQAVYPTAQLVHRLDRDTTGALILSLNPAVQEALLELFRTRKVQKTYYALVDKVPSDGYGVIKNHLGKLSVYQGQTLWGSVAASKGKLAITRWERKTRGKAASLIICYPETGRTHQIRVHLNGLGHPILGDYQYGKQFTCLYRPPRMMLHAFEVAFDHPAKGNKVRVVAPLPPDFTTTAQHVLGDRS